MKFFSKVVKEGLIPLILTLIGVLVLSVPLCLADQVNATENISLTYSAPTTLTLEQPDNVAKGQRMFFKGGLTIENTGTWISGKEIKIYDDDPLGDDLLGQDDTDEKGRYSIRWTAEEMDPVGSAIDVYAKFEGDENLEKSTSSHRPFEVKDEPVPYTPPSEDVKVDISTDNQATRITVTITFPSSGYKVEWGDLARKGNKFTANAKIWRKSGVRAMVLIQENHVYEIKDLEEGNYSFKP